MFENNEQFNLVKPRGSVEIHLPDGRVITGPRGAAVGLFLRKLPEWQDPPIVAAIINGDLRELTFPIQMDANVQPVSIGDTDGARLYRRSLTFLLEVAFEDIYPRAALTVDHSVASGGFYCQVAGRPPLNADEVAALEERMRALVAEDLPIERRQVPIAEAIAYFEKKGMPDKVRLLRYRQKSHLVLYQLQEHQDYHHGYMVPSTGFLGYFALTAMGEGFVLRYTAAIRLPNCCPCRLIQNCWRPSGNTAPGCRGWALKAWAR